MDLRWAVRLPTHRSPREESASAPNGRVGVGRGRPRAALETSALHLPGPCGGRVVRRNHRPTRQLGSGVVATPRRSGRREPAKRAARRPGNRLAAETSYSPATALAVDESSPEVLNTLG